MRICMYTVHLLIILHVMAHTKECLEVVRNKPSSLRISFDQQHMYLGIVQFVDNCT